MAEESGKSGLFSGLIKGAFTSVFGLISGAMLMYVTPLFNNAIKPGKPIANFSCQVEGLSATFTNRSTNAASGWWDFGDGSALEPFSPKQDTIKHVYPKAGNYAVKLSLQNLIGEDGERSVNVAVDPNTAPTPTIESFVVLPLTPGGCAPAAYQIKAKIKNADRCIWSLGESKSLEISDDVAATQDRYVTFEDPGMYTIRLIAANGKQTTEQSKVVTVGWTDRSDTMAKLRVSYEVVQVDRKPTSLFLKPDLNANLKSGDTIPFVVERFLPRVWQDYQIVSAEFANKDLSKEPVKDLKVEVAAEKNKIKMTGEFVKSRSFLSRAPHSWDGAEVKLIVEKRSAPMQRQCNLMPMPLNVPGSTSIPIESLNDGWQVTKRNLNLEVWDGKKLVWSGDRMPTNAVLQVKNRAVRVNAREQNNQIVLDVVDTAQRPTLAPIGN
jgi:PKD repeat protein